jgi:thiol-disulfide isomerase/thioredoxin
MMAMHRSPVLIFTVSLLATCVLAGAGGASGQRVTSARPRSAPDSTSKAAAQAKLAAQEKEAEDLKTALENAGDEPGAQARSLEQFLVRHPHPIAADEIYQLLIKDADALNDDALALRSNEALQQLHPGDLTQRIKTLNLLLLNDDPASVARAQDYSKQFAALVDEKVHEDPPEDMGEARWQVDMARLQAMARLFEGTAERKAGNYADAEGYLKASLDGEPTEEAAEELARTCVAEKKPAQALDAYTMALALPGSTIGERATLRRKAGELYRSLHNGSEVGLGDMILAHFDQVAARERREQDALNDTALANRNVTAAGSFALPDLAGKEHRLDDYRGKVVVLDFWATWCGPCLQEHPLLDDLKAKYAGSPNVVFVSINADEDRSRVQPFLRLHKWPADTWLDSGLGKFWGVDSLPTTLVLSPSGQIVFRLSGLDEDSLKDQVEAAIGVAQQAPSPAAAPAPLSAGRRNPT